MANNNKFPWQQDIIIKHSQRLLKSFENCTGNILLSVTGNPAEIAEALFAAPFVLVSHGMEADPILNYGNRTALELWELDWENFTKTPSRYTAEPIAREEREQMLNEAKTKGFISNYRGIRISSTGKRFFIEDGIIWNVFDEQQQKCGQAATFSHWTPIN